MCHDANQPNWSSMYNKIVKKVEGTDKSRHNGKFSTYLSNLTHNKAETEKPFCSKN